LFDDCCYNRFGSCIFLEVWLVDIEQSVFWFTILLIFVSGYYSLVVMPKQRAFKKHVNYVGQLEVGDEVVTYGGVVGVIVSLAVQDGLAVIRVAEGVELRVLTAAIIQRFDAADVARNAQLGLGSSDEA